MSIFDKTYQRFIYKRGEVSEGPSVQLDTHAPENVRKALDVLKKRVSTPIEKKRRDIIDPGKRDDTKTDLAEKFPEMATLIGKLDAIEKKEFTLKMVRGRKPTDEKDRLEGFVKNMKEALLFRAITQSWSEEELVDEYTSTMQSLFAQSYSVDGFMPTLQRFYNKLGDMSSSWDTHDKPQKINHTLESNKNSIREDRPFLLATLESKRQQIRAAWITPKIEKNMSEPLEFAEKQAIPFLAYRHVDEGIVKDFPKQTIIDNFWRDVDDCYYSISHDGEARPAPVDPNAPKPKSIWSWRPW